jgi:hypothetical protein
MSEREFFRFTNPLDITIGRGRIIWAEATEHKGLVHPAGWVLPGANVPKQWPVLLIGEQREQDATDEARPQAVERASCSEGSEPF